MLRQKAETYGGHRIAAAPGTHAAIMSELEELAIPKQAAILDFGAFTGAMLYRLKEAGYTNLTASDLDNHLKEEGIPLVVCDLNQDFSKYFGKFDCIIASEVIEHLNDPRHFLSQCQKILNEDGVILVSTPNIAFFEGRIKFFLKGELWGYGAHNYIRQRHISPISREQFPLLFEECGFEQISMTTRGSFATVLRQVLTSPIWLVMRVAFGATVIGESLICVGRKKATTSNRLSSKALWGAASKK